MRILVTGGAGFIGTNLCQKLLKNDHQTVACDNFITGQRKNLDVLLANSKFQFYQIDITEKVFLDRFKSLEKFDQIYHLACPTGVVNLIPLAEEMLTTCAQGTRQVLELARFHKAKVLFTSSSEVYGDPKVSPQTEEYNGSVDPTGLRSPYEEGKRFAESLVVMYQRKYKVPVKIVRVFNTYGSFMSLKDSRVIPTLLHQALSKKPLTIHGKGIQRRTFLYVDDLVNGLIQVMERGQNGHIYNLGSDSEISISELAQTVLNLTKTKSSFRFVKRPAHDHEMRLPSIDKAKKLGWSPQTSLRDGLLKSISFMKKQKSD